MAWQHLRYVIYAILTILVAFIYYVWDAIFKYKFVLYFPHEILIALVWTVAAVLTWRAGRAEKRKTWWVWLFCVPAYAPAVTSIITFAFWKFRGFAP